MNRLQLEIETKDKILILDNDNLSLCAVYSVNHGKFTDRFTACQVVVCVVSMNLSIVCVCECS